MLGTPIHTRISTDISTPLDASAAASESALEARLNIIGSKGRELWMSDLGVNLVGGEVDSWVGQINGITLSAAGAANRCAVTAANASFNNAPSIDTDGVANWLRNLAISPALYAIDDDFVLYVVQKYTSAYSAGSNELVHMSNAGGQMAKNGSRTEGTVLQAFLVQSTFVTLSVVLPQTDPALFRVTRDRALTVSNCFVFAHNATVTTDTEGATDLTGEIDRMALGAQTGGILFGECQTCEIYCGHTMFTAGEHNAYKALILADYGIVAA